MIRLIISIVFLCISLLTIFKAPAYHLWLAAILVSEFPLLPIFLTCLLIFWGFRIKKYQTAGMLIGFAALCLFVSPAVRAYRISKTLPGKITSVFKARQLPPQSPFSFVKLLYLKNKSQITAKQFSYKQYGNLTLNLDFYPAQATGKRPCIVVIHGGSWKSGDNKQLLELNSFLASAGYHVAAITYRLAPEFKSPMPVQDVKAAVAYLKLHATSFHIDTTKMVLLGRSAGAQIALLAAYTLHDPAIKGVIDFYGPADMVWGYSIPANPLVMNSRKVMEDYLGGKYTDVATNYINSSPIEFVTKVSPPTLIIHGENDVLVAYKHSVRLQNRLHQWGIKNYFLSLPWATHGFDYTINGPGGQLSTYAVKHFLASVTQ